MALRVALPLGKKGVKGINDAMWLCRSAAFGLHRLCPPSASITGKTMREPSTKPAPFPYKTKKLSFIGLIFDSTSKRFDENTKLIVVEGNIAAGKTSLAKALAEELDMLYVPEANMDLEYKNSYGHDLRDYNHLLPEKMKTYDVTDFYKNPNDPAAARFQMCMYKHRYYQYLDVLMHIFNTGQGVVMDRCVYSDFCFLETMVKHGYLSEKMKYFYYEVRKNSIEELLRPHLVIYLDVPVNIVQERIKIRNQNNEVDSSVLTPSYLQTLSDVYKQQYLKEIGKHAELLIYDWSNFGDAEMVVEDIERIDFDKFDKYDEKMKDWRLFDEEMYSEKRWEYTGRNHILKNYLNVPILDVPEVMGSGEDIRQYREVYDKVPGNRYAPGYNKDMGDTGLLFK